MRRVIGAVTTMLRDIFKSKTVKRAEAVLVEADANLVRINQLAASESGGARRFRLQIERLDAIIGEGRR